MCVKDVSSCPPRVLNLTSLLTIVTLFLSVWCFAAPYGPNGKSALYPQPDGTKVQVKVFGDEFYAVAETVDGYTVVYDQNKVLRYAQLSADGKSFVPTALKASNRANAGVLKGLGISKHLRLSAQGRKEAIARGLKRMKADNRGRTLPPSNLNSPSSASALDGPSFAPPSVTRIGQYVGLCMLIDFSDQPGEIPRSNVDDYCNKPGYTGYSNATSIYDYFFIQSGGTLRYNNIVTAYVRVPKPKTYYDNNIDEGWGASTAQEMVAAGLDVLMAQGFDFTQLSRDAGGTIYSLNVFYAGTCTSSWSTGLWPHKWAIPTKTVDAANGIKAYTYQMSDMGTALDIGTFCHENGHMLMQYPDLYSYNGNANNMGNFTLMAGGSHTGGGKHPANVDPYLKNASGWMDVIELNSSSHKRCVVQVDGNQMYRYLNPARAQEYFVFEVRDNTGYEGVYGGATTSVNPAAGLVAYHALESGSSTHSTIFTADNPNCNYTTPYEMMVIEASPPAINPWYDDPSPSSADAFKASGVSAISDSTTPELKFWSSSGRTTTSNCNIHSISADGPTMTFVIGSGAPTGTPAVELSRSTITSSCNFGTNAPSQTFAICNGQSGTLSYTVSESLSWLTCSVANGTATTEADVVTVSFQTSTLSAGTYNGTITVSDGGSSTKTINVNLTVWPQPTLAVDPASLSATGTTGLPGETLFFKLDNIGGGTATYTVSKTQPWLTLDPASGTVMAETDYVYVTCDSTSLIPGTYNDTLTISSPEATNSPLTIPVTFTVQGTDMILTSPDGAEQWIWNSTYPITWASSLGGNVKIELLKGGLLDSVIIASTLNDGSYDWTVPFGKTAGTDYRVRVTSVEQPSKVDSSNADFSIINPPIYFTDCEGTEPTGFTRGGLWEWGTPGGNNAASSAHSGTSMFDTDLDNTCWGSHVLTSVAIDCSEYTSVQLQFFASVLLRYDTGSFPGSYTYRVEVSNTGTDWGDTPGKSKIIYDSGLGMSAVPWTEYNYDISAIADGQPTVYIRWSQIDNNGGNYQTTGGGVAIDDIKLTGVFSPPHGVAITQTGGTTDVTEGGATDTYSVVLNSQPSANVTITIGTADGETSVNPTSLTFTDANWNNAQTVTVTAVDDTDHELNHSGTITHSAASSDGNYNGVTISDVVVSITDNDNSAPTVSIAPTEQTVYLSGTPAPAPVAGADIFLDAGQDPDNGTNGVWEDTLVKWSPTIDTTNVSFVADAGSALGGITAAYDFVGGITGGAGGCEGLGLSDMGANGTPITLEIWFKPDTITGHPANGQILWETGGGTGLGIFYRDGFVETAHDSNAGQISTDVTALVGEFIQVVVTFDTTGSTDNYKLYINGALKSTGSRPDTNLCGGDDSGLGERGQNNAGGAGSGDSNTESFDGKIAIFRAYHNQILSEADVLQNYQSVAGTGISATATVVGTVIDTDGDPTTKTWTKDSGPDVVDFSTPYAATTDATFYTEGTYVLRLDANDTVATGTNTCIVHVNPVVTTLNVLYDGNGSTGGTVPVDANSPYDPDVTVTVLGNTGGLVRTGYTYNDWNTAADGTGTPYAAGNTFTITAHTTLYAQWTGNTYAITFDKQSGTGGSNGVTATYGSPMPAASAPTRAGFIFGGYFTGTNGTGTQYYTDTMASAQNWDITANTTLYAKWTASYTVNFLTDGTAGSSLTGQASQTVATGTDCSAVTANAPAGYHFVNWTKDAAAYSTNNPLTVTNVTANMTLVANFIKDPTITIADDGTLLEEAEDGEVITVTLADGIFTAPITAANWTVSGLPAGVTKGTVTRISDTIVEISLSGNRAVDYDSNITNLSVSCTAAEISTAIAPTSANSGVTFTATNDPESIEIVDDGWILEGAENGELITVILSGGTFASSLNAGNWTLSNLPTGVSKGTVTRVSDIVATIALSGNRSVSYGGSNITNVTVTCTATEYADSSGGGSLSDNNGVTLRALVGGMIVLQDGLNGYTGTRDTYIDVENSGVNYGTTSPMLLSNRTTPARDKHGLLYFDLSGIPELTPSTIITSVTLELTDNGGTAGIMGVYEATGPWGETTANYTNSSGLLGGTAYATANAPGTANSTISLPLDSNGVNLVKSWVANASNNHGFSLISALTGNNEVSQIRTREYGTPAQRPKLTINYLGDATEPEMTVKGQGITINSGDTTPTPADDTAFGNVTQGTPVTHTFTILNDGSADLTLSGVSSDNGDFTVTQPGSSTVVAGGNITFTVAFDPTIPNLQTATITIANDDADEGSYTFRVSAIGDTGGGPQIADASLPAGISLYGYTGANPVDIEAAFQTLITNDQLSLVRWVNPLNGNIKELYYTTFPTAGWVNEIGDMTLGQGYVVKTKVGCTLAIAGSKSTGSVVYNLPAGYCIIGFNKETPIDAIAAFQELITNDVLELVRWVDPANGQIRELYYTTFPTPGWINEIDTLIEGQGYIIKLKNPYNGFSFP